MGPRKRVGLQTKTTTYRDRERDVLGHVGPEHVALDDLQRERHALEQKLQLALREEVVRHLQLNSSIHMYMISMEAQQRTKVSMQHSE